MDYGEIITKSARLIWKFKILWIFGLLAGCASGSVNFNYLLDAVNYNFSNSYLPVPLQQFFNGLSDLLRQTQGWFVAAVLLLACGLGIVFWLIGILGRTSVARGAWLAEGGTQKLEFGPLFNESLPAFWRVAGVNLIIGVPGFAISLLFIVFALFSLASSFSGRSEGLALLFLCIGLPLCCLLVPLFWFMGIWSEISTVAVAGEGRGVLDALRRGWRLLTHNLGPVILMAVLVLVAQVGFSVLLGIIFAPIGLGAMLGDMYLGNQAGIGLGLLIPLLAMAVLVSLAVGAIFYSYIGAVWVLVFNRLAAREIPPQPQPQPQPASPVQTI